MEFIVSTGGASGPVGERYEHFKFWEDKNIQEEQTSIMAKIP
jgi:hypothetical protein